MKKYIFNILALLAVLVMTGCSKDEIVFESELPQFETREGYQLLEVIMPPGTGVDDNIYIVGEFNGGLEAALSNPQWELQKSPTSDYKWGIYLDPSTFVNGKTLADGYYFYNKQQREERTALNQEVMHYENPAVGGRANVTVVRWASYFDKPVDPSEIEHDGYVIYVVDNSGYDELAMYAWGDAECFGGWPGMTPTGEVTKEGVTYKYFDTGEANKGLNENLIFNNNGNGSQLGDYNVTLDKDYYLELTPDGVQEFDPSSAVEHDGYAVFVVNKTGWDNLYMYMWGDVNNLNGEWPGMSPTGIQKINGVEYTYFDLGASNNGLGENLIFNNGDGTQLSDVAFTIDRDLYLEITTSGATEIDPATYDPNGSGTGDQGDPMEYSLYLENATGWDALWVYAWGEKELFGAWPGATYTETVEIAGRTFGKITMTGAGESENLIFHNNDGTQFDGPAIAVDRDYYFTVTADSATEIDASTLKGPKRRIHKARR